MKTTKILFAIGLAVATITGVAAAKRAERPAAAAYCHTVSK